MDSCEDFPCCGHELGDCNGQKYGSDESIMRSVWRQMRGDERAYQDDDY